MPQLLYYPYYTPIWIALKIFIKMNIIFSDFILRRKAHYIKLELLQYTRDAGGLAVPNPSIYFFAPQLQHLAGSSASYCLFSYAFGGQPPLHVLEGAVCVCVCGGGGGYGFKKCTSSQNIQYLLVNSFFILFFSVCREVKTSQVMKTLHRGPDRRLPYQ